MMNELATRLSSNETRLDSWEKDAAPYFQFFFHILSSKGSSSCSYSHKSVPFASTMRPTHTKNVPTPKTALQRMKVNDTTPIHQEKMMNQSDLERYLHQVQQATLDRINSWDPHSFKKRKGDQQQQGEKATKKEKKNNHGNTVETNLDTLVRLWSLRISGMEKQQRIKEIVQQQYIPISENLKTKQKENDAKQRMDALLCPLTPSEKSIVQEAFYGKGHPQQIIAKNLNSGDTIQRTSIRRLRPGKWLNDEVIHYFFVMLANRDASTTSQRMNENQTPRRSHFYKSFFLTKLLDEGGTNQYAYSNVKSWSKNVPGQDIFLLDKIFIPVNLSNVHWACAVIFMQERRIQFYDSMGGDGKYYLDALFRYVKDEWKNKNDGKELPHADEWKLVTCRPDTPRQENGFDCGVFTCMFADFLSMGYPLLFTQSHVTQCRERIALSIMQGAIV